MQKRLLGVTATGLSESSFDTVIDKSVLDTFACGAWPSSNQTSGIHKHARTPRARGSGDFSIFSKCILFVVDFGLFCVVGSLDLFNNCTECKDRINAHTEVIMPLRSSTSTYWRPRTLTQGTKFLAVLRCRSIGKE